MKVTAIMKPRVVYAGLCVLGTILPYSQFVPFLREYGFDFPLFIRQLFANRVSSFFGMDVIVSSVVLCVFISVDGRRIGVRHRWAPVVTLLTVGVSLALPLFLYMREARLNRPAPVGSAAL